MTFHEMRKVIQVAEALAPAARKIETDVEVGDYLDAVEVGIKAAVQVLYTFDSPQKPVHGNVTLGEVVGAVEAAVEAAIGEVRKAAKKK